MKYVPDICAFLRPDTHVIFYNVRAIGVFNCNNRTYGIFITTTLRLIIIIIMVNVCKLISGKLQI